MFGLEVSGFEIVARTIMIYAALLFALRVAGKREMGQMTPFDLVVILLISESVQGAMTAGEMSVTGGLLAAGVLIGVNHAVGIAQDRIPFLGKMLVSSSTPLVRGGRFLHGAMHSEGVTEGEVLAAMRAHGVEEVAGVRLAVLEADGTISVVPKQGKKPQKERRRTPTRRA